MNSLKPMILVLISLSGFTDARDDLTILTRNGNISGLTLSVKISSSVPKQVYAWRGIPFAESPTEERRFKMPEPVKNWSGVLETTKFPKSCYQSDEFIPTLNSTTNDNKFSEDCLYLNVYAPLENRRTTKAAVMVWINGGSFDYESDYSEEDAKFMVAETKVIFVRIQYRQSIFGFLYLNTTDAPGNQGLHDQQLAIKWVRENIEAFGGDPEKITLFGQGSGSTSVGLHLVSPLSKPLFNNAIMQSGSALSPRAIADSDTSISAYLRILSALKCNGSIEAQIDCARNVSARKLLRISKSNSDGFVFAPVVDGYFLEANPTKEDFRNRSKRCPILLGSNKDEGDLFAALTIPHYTSETVHQNINSSSFKKYMEAMFRYYPKFPFTTDNSTLESILDRYTNWADVENRRSNFNNLNNAYGDFMYVCPTLDIANAYAQNQQNVYSYFFTHRSSRNIRPQWFGAIHSEEIPFVLGSAIKYVDIEFNYNLRERNLSRKMMQAWTNFANFSNPNGPSGGNAWPRYTITNLTNDTTQRAYLTLDINNFTVGYKLRSRFCEFWNTLSL